MLPLLLLLPTFPTTLATTIATLAVAVTGQVIALASHPSPCCVTSLSLGLRGLLVTMTVTSSQTTLSPRGHGRDVRAVWGVILIGTTMASNGAFSTCFETCASPC